MNGRRTTPLIIGFLLALAGCHQDAAASDDSGAPPPPTPPPAAPDDAGMTPTYPSDPPDAGSPTSDSGSSSAPDSALPPPPPPADGGPTGSGMPCVVGLDFGDGSGGGFGCPDGEICVDDPSDTCDGDARDGCPGICDVAPSGTPGSDGSGDGRSPGSDGFGAAECYPDFPVLSCPDGATCVDDPSDDCTPGGSSGLPCPGLCTR